MILPSEAFKLEHSFVFSKLLLVLFSNTLSLFFTFKLTTLLFDFLLTKICLVLRY